jgi:hypothetical protein
VFFKIIDQSNIHHITKRTIMCFPQSQTKVTFITSPKEQSAGTFHCSWSFFLLLVFEAGLAGLAAT